MYFIARRIYQNGEAGRVSASAVRIATAGVAVGILVMIISICVTVGFQSEIKTRIASLIGHIQIINTQSQYRTTYSVPIQINESLRNEIQEIPGVKTVRRFSQCPGMVKTDAEFRGIFFRGIEAVNTLSFLEQNLITGKVPSFGCGEVPSDSILLSSTMASSLQIQVGDKVHAYFFDGGLRARRFVVSGIFSTNIADFDTRMCYADIRSIQRLAGWEQDQFSGAEVILDDFNSIHSISSKISEMMYMREDAYGYYYFAPCVDELFPQIFSWLTLLDINVIAILILMICIAGVTMTSGLLIIILERTRFIGVMKAMGATNGQLRRIFLYLATMIVVRGLIYGNTIALSILFLQKLTGIIKLDPASYYLSQVPVYFPWAEIIIINIVTLIVCVSVLVVPSYIISRIQPVRSIKFE